MRDPYPEYRGASVQSFWARFEFPFFLLLCMMLLLPWLLGSDPGGGCHLRPENTPPHCWVNGRSP